MNSLKEEVAKKVLAKELILAFKSKEKGNVLIAVNQSQIEKLEKGVKNESGGYHVIPTNVGKININPCDKTKLKILQEISESPAYITPSREFAKELYDHFLDLIEIAESLSVTSRAESWLKKEELWKKL